MIIIKLTSGLGNQMFQYAIGRIIAEGKGYKLEIQDLDNKKDLLFKNFRRAGVLKKRSFTRILVPSGAPKSHV